MTRTFRIAGIAAIVLVAAIAGAIYYLASNLDHIVAGLIEEQGSAATGTPVRVDSVSIDLREATGSISGLTVGNPEGFADAAAIEFGDFSLRLDAGSLFSDPVVIENVEIDSAMLRIEQVGPRNNLQTLLDNLRGDAAETPAEADAGPRLVIERFVLTGAAASLSVPELDEQRSVEVPDVVLTGIGRNSGGATGPELARQVLEPVIREALQSSAAQAAKDKLRDTLEEKAGDLADGLLDRLGGNDDGDE